jgi:hypothetical protein
MENKQTAVEWLIDQMFKQGYFDGNKPLSITNLDHLQHEAKQMEKEQIINAHNHGFTEGTCFGANPILGYKFITAQQYYKETYGQSI